MAGRSKRGRRTGRTLTREQVLDAAVALADEVGIDALSMRKLGARVGVEAMSLYNHVANKEDLLDGLVERIVAEIALPEPGEDWKEAMRRRARSARAVFRRHPWGVTLMESREHPGPNALRYYEAVIRCLREGGFPIALAAHAFSLLDSYLYGFALQEQSMPFETADELATVADGILAGLPVDTHPHFAEMIAYSLSPGYSYAAEFEYGLELILDGLERRLPG